MTNSFTPMEACMIVEGVYDVDEDVVLEAWQSLIDSDVVWMLQGFYARTATRLIEQGLCTND